MCPSNILIVGALVILAGLFGASFLRMSALTKVFTLGSLALFGVAFYFYKSNLVQQIKLPDQQAKYVYIGLGAVFISAMIVMGRFYNKLRIERWASENGYQLLNYRGAWFFEGPGAWIRSQHEDAFRFEIIDQYGKKRTGWIKFGSYMGFDPDKINVDFDPLTLSSQTV